MDEQYIEKMKEWIDLDNVYTSLRKQLNELTEKKKDIEDDILEYIEDNNLEKVVVSVCDGTLKFPKRTVQQSLSMKVLKQVIGKYNEEKSQNIEIEELVKFISTNLETKTKLSIKRDVR
jgi:predicted site-specific integrase-resolvase